MGLFHEFLDDTDVAIIGVEAGGARRMGAPAYFRAADCVLEPAFTSKDAAVQAGAPNRPRRTSRTTMAR
mgnify:CR=1 FL=1